MNFNSLCWLVMSLIFSSIASSAAYADDNSVNLRTSFKVIAETCEVINGEVLDMTRHLGDIDISSITGKGEKSKILNKISDTLTVKCEASKKALVRFSPVSDPCKAYNGNVYSCGKEGQTVGLMLNMSALNPKTNKWSTFRVPGDKGVTKEIKVDEKDGSVKSRIERVYYSELQENGASPGNISAEYVFIVYNE